MLETLFDRYIAAVMNKSADELAALFSEDGRLSLPFRRNREVISGRENIRQHYAQGFSIAPLCFTAIEDIRFHQTAVPHIAVVEYRLHGHTLPDQKMFTLSYVNVITGDNGKIRELMDYEDVLNREDIFTH